MLIRGATVDEVMDKLRQRVKDKPTMASLLPVYEQFLRMEAEIDSAPPPLSYPPSETSSILEQGVPLLHRVEGPVVRDSMATVWQRVCRLAAQNIGDEAERWAELEDWPEAEREAWTEGMRQYFRQGDVEAEAQGERELLTFVMVHTWRPFLCSWAVDLAPLVDEGVWKESRCPVCGGEPDFAYLGEDSGDRHLVCARCDTEWRYKRLGCPFCGNQDASTYGYYPDEEGVYRLYACKRCSRYLKVLDLREVGGKRLLPVERIATMGMDLSALKAGYRGT